MGQSPIALISKGAPPPLTKGEPTKPNTLERSAGLRLATVLSIGHRDDLAFVLGSLAARIHHWQQATFFFQASLQFNGKHHATHYNLGIVHWQLAQHDEAEPHLHAAVNLDADQAHYHKQLDTLRIWRDTCRDRLGADIIMQRSQQHPIALTAQNQLYATLLGPHHAQALLRQQSDAQVAQLTGVPQLHTIGEARRWIESQLNNQHKTTLTIFHPTWGLVGVVVLETSNHAALFYYWIGKAFQNQGYGRQALDFMCRAAAHLDIDRLFSTVHQDNHRSQRVLQSSGFQALPYAIEPQDEPLQYYHKRLTPRSNTQEESPVYQILQQLLKHTNAGHRLATPAKEVGQPEVQPC